MCKFLDGRNDARRGAVHRIVDYRVMAIAHRIQQVPPRPVDKRFKISRTGCRVRSRKH